MRDYLIVLNYQREVPPFMISQLKYASRHFKKVTGMTPSEYASSVKILAGKTRPGGSGH